MYKLMSLLVVAVLGVMCLSGSPAAKPSENIYEAKCKPNELALPLARPTKAGLLGFLFCGDPKSNDDMGVPQNWRLEAYALLPAEPIKGGVEL